MIVGNASQGPSGGVGPWNLTCCCNMAYSQEKALFSPDITQEACDLTNMLFGRVDWAKCGDRYWALGTRIKLCSL